MKTNFDTQQAQISISDEKGAKLLLSIAQNPTNYKKVVDLLDCLATYSPNFWENAISQQTNSDRQFSSSTAAINYKALVALLVPTTVFEWLSWLKTFPSKQIALDSLMFQEYILGISRQRPRACENLRVLIRAGISHLLFQLIGPAISPDDYQNVEWLLVRQKRQNVWHDQFHSYTSNILDQLPNFLSSDRTHYQDGFYSKLAETVQELEEQGWRNNLPEFLGLAKLMQKYENYELSALFYQISIACVPREIWSNMSKVSLQQIMQYVPLRREPSFFENMRKSFG